MTGNWRDAWTSALDGLEMDVTSTETMLQDSHRLAEIRPPEPWRPPTGLGTLPAELAPRADEILTRQLKVAEEIAHRLTFTRQQTAMTARIETGEAVKRPIFLDCAL
ncbi:MAG: hypothetical protein ABWX96_01110 [Propionibacteriaceae bacterium]